MSVRLEEKPEHDPRPSTFPICWCREDAAGQFLSTRNSPLIQRTRAQSSDSPAGHSLRSDYVSSQPPDRSVLCPNFAPTPSCRHSDQEKNGMSAVPHAMCIDSTSQGDGLLQLPCGRRDSPWVRSRNLVGTTSSAGSPCCPRTEARQPRSRMDHSPTPPPQALVIEWDPPCRCPRHGFDVVGSHALPSNRDNASHGVLSTWATIG